MATLPCVGLMNWVAVVSKIRSVVVLLMDQLLVMTLIRDAMLALAIVTLAHRVALSTFAAYDTMRVVGHVLVIVAVGVVVLRLLTLAYDVSLVVNVLLVVLGASTDQLHLMSLHSFQVSLN